jgi:UDP-glucose:(heptosyl)LPS alpha-1,3-glucosyltransferase
MACGLPVITSATCGGAEFITIGQNGYVCDALNIPQLSEAVMAISSRFVDEKMGEYARERVRDATPEKLSQQLISLYQNILD